MAADYEYLTAVFSVGLDGFTSFDHEELNAWAEEGWEPFQMSAVHNGFAVVVMFRREREPPPPPPPQPAKKAAAAKKKTTLR